MSDNNDGILSRHKFLALGSGAALAIAGCSGGGGSPTPSGGGGGSATSTPTAAPTATSKASPTPAPTATPQSLPFGTTDVTIRRSVQMGAVPKQFVSLSYEKGKISEGFFTASNTALIGCFKLLGKSIIRMGGISADQTTWNANGAGGVSGEVAPADIDAFAAFIKATGWSVMYGINLVQNTTAAAAAECAYAASALGSNLYSFEIGNEADLYKSSGTRPNTYTLADYEQEWSTYQAAIKASVPSAVFAGPESASSYYNWTIPFAAAQTGKLSVLTQHYSRGDGNSADSTMAVLLAQDTSLPGEFSALSSATMSNSNTLGYRITEANSFYNGGAAGVSNAFGSALWAVDVMLLAATYGAAGIHFNSGDNGPGYTPIGDSNEQVVSIRPEYYGMLLVSQISPGSMYAVNVNTGLNLTAYAVAGSDNATYLIIINKDGSTTANTNVALGANGNSYTQLILAGSGLNALTGTTLGNALVSTSGTWTPQASPAVSIGGAQTFNVQIAPATAVILKIV